MILDRYVPSLWIYASMERKDTVFLDSSMHNDLGRRSYIGMLPRTVFTKGDVVQILDSIGEDDVLMGYVSYDRGLMMHGLDAMDDDESGFALGDFDIVVIDDPASETLEAICRGRVMDADKELALVESIISKAGEPVPSESEGYEIVSDMDREDFIDAVRRAQDSMRAGDYYVINMTRRIELRSSTDPFDVFLRLRRRSPSPFGAYIDLGGLHIVSSSMELLLEMENGMTRTRPIKGTSPRTGDPSKDRRSLESLLSSEKDRSELLMVSDMERNDMNRFCIPGSVEVESFFEPEEYATVFHTISDIVGTVRRDVGIGEAFGCMFPGGSVTGAPKEACMEAISELEQGRRGLYTGSAGLFSKNRTVANILIRTLVHRDGMYSLGVGGGITVESDPESEYEETVQKGRAILESIRGGDMEHDDGFSFGIGAFETMSVTDGRCVMLDRHLDRLNSSLERLGIDRRISRRDILERTEDRSLDGRVLKVEVSERNIVFSDRANPYDEDRRSRGFRLRIFDVRRNESSPFTYMKSLQYGDSIMEKRRAMKDGYDEPLFLNSRGEICEGATTNIFFVDGDRIVTPPVSCGMLPGTVRSYVMERFDVEETILHPDDIGDFQGCFVTNSLMGAMNVASIDGTVFRDRSVTDKVFRTYLEDIDHGLR